MSELTICNFCNLRSIKRRCGPDEQVTVLSDAAWGMGGKNVYVHPADVKIAELPGGEDGERKQYRVSWMQEIPKRCEC